MAKRAMKRTFRNRAGLSWAFWRRVANRLKRKAAKAEAESEE